ncbi:MAG TPA: hypothetical protein VGB26_03550 [Nitrospiria bacterium]|jgi:hypothetical protein
MNHYLLTQNGISLVETLLGTALTLLILGFALDFGSSCLTRFSQMEHQIEIQQQTRIGIEMLMHEIKKAGYGLPSGWPAFLVIGPSFVSFQSNLDEIQTRLTSDAFPGSTVIFVESGKGFRAGKSILICTGGVCEEGILNNHGSIFSLTLKNSLNHFFPSGSSVNVLNRVSYYLNQKNQLLRKVDQGGTNEVANQVQTLKMKYQDHKGNPTWNPLAAKLVRITLETQSQKGDQRSYSSSIGIRNQ